MILATIELSGAQRQAWNKLWSTYGTQVLDQAGLMLAGAAVAIALAATWRRCARRAPPPAMVSWGGAIAVAGALAWGLVDAIDRAACFDDAFISFRYAQNLVAGHGLVFNVGERVEGYTNFLWTVIIALVHGLTGISLPRVAVAGALVCYVGTVLTTYAISQALCARGSTSPSRLALPVAAVGVALQMTMTAHATTGLETALAPLLVLLGAWCLVREPTLWSCGAAGACLILATLTRMDHAIFYAAGAWVLVQERGSELWTRRREGLRPLWDAGLRYWAAYAAAFLVYAAYLGWKTQYYGDIYPNTYYAKSANLPYWSQGLLYTASFLLGSHLLWFLPILVAAIWRRDLSPPARRFRRFALPAIAVFVTYVTRVGGDFMFARFFVSLVPLVLLVTELTLTSWLRGSSPRAVLAGVATAALFGATVRGVDLFETGRIGYIGDENRHYKLTAWNPIEIHHDSWRVAQELAKLSAAGLDPLIATSGPGMLGYYSQLRMVDVLGLIDPVVAHQPLAKRSRPGHEKRASKAYLRERNPHFFRHTRRSKGRPVTRIRWSQRAGRSRWYIYHYDRELMRRVREILPEVSFVDFEAYLDDYLAAAQAEPPEDLRRDAAFFRRYYFDHNDDAQRSLALETLLRRRRGH
ncbi:MAG: hypothetical protein B7733_19300 [Myxococcales bacterium FL481]|nr:MAG: hypothetical protein B7733_19300 [Myxococcales bacterium FL481]